MKTKVQNLLITAIFLLLPLDGFSESYLRCGSSGQFNPRKCELGKETFAKTGVSLEDFPIQNLIFDEENEEIFRGGAGGYYVTIKYNQSVDEMRTFLLMNVDLLGKYIELKSLVEKNLSIGSGSILCDDYVRSLRLCNEQLEGMKDFSFVLTNMISRIMITSTTSPVRPIERKSVMLYLNPLEFESDQDLREFFQTVVDARKVGSEILSLENQVRENLNFKKSFREDFSLTVDQYKSALTKLKFVNFNFQDAASFIEVLMVGKSNITTERCGITVQIDFRKSVQEIEQFFKGDAFLNAECN
jgi:hypothetical protein